MYDRAATLRWKYKLSIADFDDMLADQDGRCAICRCVEPGGRGTWHVDHDHFCCPSEETCGNCIRGLLCARCNALLGRINDDQKILASAIRYLKQGGYEA